MNIEIIAIVLGVIIVMLQITFFVYNKKKKEKLNEAIRDKIDNRVWSIPIELECQQCKAKLPVDFDLGMYRTKCPECGTDNRIFIYFHTALESPDLNHLSI